VSSNARCFGHQPDGVIEIGIADLAAFQRADPEGALDVVARRERQAPPAA